MEKLKAWQTPIVIIAIVVVAGLLTALWPTISGSLLSGGRSTNTVTVTEPRTASTVNVDLEGMFYTIANEYFSGLVTAIDGPYNGLAVLAFLTVVIFGGVIVVGLLIMFLVRLGDRRIGALKESADYQTAVAHIESAEKQYIQTNVKQNPPKAKPSGLMPRWSVISTTLLFMVLAYWLGVVIGAEVSSGSKALFGWTFAIMALVVSVYRLRPATIYSVDTTDYDRTPRGTLWVILSGALIVGLGLGFMFAVINGRDPFPFLDAAWWQENIIIPLTS